MNYHGPSPWTSTPSAPAEPFCRTATTPGITTACRTSMSATTMRGTAMYSLPFKGNRWIQGYQLSTILQDQTGNPVNITDGNSTFNGVTGLICSDLLDRS